MKTQTLDLIRFINEPGWFTELRQKALYQSIELPLPESRFTRWRGLDLHRLSELPPVPKKVVTPHLLEPEKSPLKSPLTFFFSDGVLKQVSSAYQAYTSKLQVLSLEHALHEVSDPLKKTLTLWTPQDKLEALHLAYLVGGVVIFVPDGVQVEDPVYIQIKKSLAYALSFQTWIFLGKESSLTVVQENIAKGEEGYLSHIVHAQLSEGSRLNYGSIQALKSRIYHMQRRVGEVGRDAHLDWSSLWMGAKLIQAKTETYLQGPGAEATDSQVFFGTDRQHIDITSNLRHQVPNTQGYVFIQGALKDRARAVLQGMIRIDPGAQNTNSYLEEHALLLNRGTHADTEPALEIEADDVRASHAATVSKIEDDRVFYLQSRGLPKPEAIKLIAWGFLTPGIQKLKIPYIRERLDQLFEEKWGAQR